MGAAAALSYTGLYDLGSGIGESVIERLMGKEGIFEGIPPQAVVSPVPASIHPSFDRTRTRTLLELCN